MNNIGRYNLSWNEFESCTSNSFKGLIAREEFVDVTLACDDDKQVKAHKVILSACSDFFRNILLKNNHQHPLIYLDNLKVEYLQALIDFMYLGETNIPQDMFSGFIKAAQKFKIKGLAEHGEEIPQIKSKKRRHQSLNNAAPTPVNIKEEFVLNEETSIEVLKHTIVGTLANHKYSILEPETKLEVVEEEISQDVTDELTEVNVMEEEPMDDSEVDSLKVDDDITSANATNAEDMNTNLAGGNSTANMDSDVDDPSDDEDYLPNENETFSDDEIDKGDGEGEGSRSVEEEIEIESIVDIDERVLSLEEDDESVGDDNEDSENEDDGSDEEESTDDDEESLADEDTECEDDSNSEEDEILVKEEGTLDEDESQNDTKPNPMTTVQQEEKLLMENNNKDKIKKEKMVDDWSDFEFL